MSPAPLQEAVRLRANYADAYTAMGVSLKELGRKAEAQACFQVVARLRPGCALSLGNLAGIFYEQVRARYDVRWPAAADGLRGALQAAKALISGVKA